MPHPGPPPVQAIIYARAAEAKKKAAEDREKGLPTPQKEPVNPSPKAKTPLKVQTPRYGWCPQCEFGYRVLTSFNPQGKSQFAGRKKFQCSNESKTGCLYWDLVPEDAVLLEPGVTPPPPMRKGNCPKCQFGNLVERVLNPFNFREKWMECSRKSDPERPCDYRETVKPSNSETPREPTQLLNRMLSAKTKGSPSGNVLGPSPSPIRKQPIANHRRQSSQRPSEISRPMRSPEKGGNPAARNARPITNKGSSEDEDTPLVDEGANDQEPPQGGYNPQHQQQAGRHQVPPPTNPPPAQQRNSSQFQRPPPRGNAQRTAQNPGGAGSESRREDGTNAPQHLNIAASHGTNTRPGSYQQAASYTAQSAAFSLDGPPIVYDLTGSKPQTPPNNSRNHYYPTPDSSRHPAVAPKHPITNPRKPVATPVRPVTGPITNKFKGACDEYDEFGLDDEDLIGIAEQVERQKKRARSQSSDYGSLDGDTAEHLMQMVDDVADSTAGMTNQPRSQFAVAHQPRMRDAHRPSSQFQGSSHSHMRTQPRMPQRPTSSMYTPSQTPSYARPGGAMQGVRNTSNVTPSRAPRPTPRNIPGQKPTGVKKPYSYNNAPAERSVGAAVGSNRRSTAIVIDD